MLLMTLEEACEFLVGKDDYQILSLGDTGKWIVAKVDEIPALRKIVNVKTGEEYFQLPSVKHVRLWLEPDGTVTEEELI